MSGLRSSFTRKWLVTGMPSHMLKSNQNNCKQNSPRIVVSWTVPVVSDQPWNVLVGGGGVKTLPFCLGTAYNVCSMEDTEISWLLCWQWKHAAQNIIYLYFKNSSSGTSANPWYHVRRANLFTFISESSSSYKKAPVRDHHCHLYALLLIDIEYDYDWISFAMNYNV